MPSSESCSLTARRVELLLELVERRELVSDLSRGICRDKGLFYLTRDLHLRFLREDSEGFGWG